MALFLSSHDRTAPTGGPTPTFAPITVQTLAPTGTPGLPEANTYLSIDPHIFYDELSTKLGSPRVPVEVAENIVDYASDISTWMACALVCKSWFPRSRMHFWREVTVHNLRQLYALCDVLGKTPEVRSLVRTLRIVNGHGTVDSTGTALVTVLPLIPYANSLTINVHANKFSHMAPVWIGIHRNLRNLTLEQASHRLVHTIRLLSYLNFLEVLTLLPNYSNAYKYPPQNIETSTLIRRCAPCLRELHVSIAL